MIIGFAKKRVMALKLTVFDRAFLRAHSITADGYEDSREVVCPECNGVMAFDRFQGHINIFLWRCVGCGKVLTNTSHTQNNKESSYNGP